MLNCLVQSCGLTCFHDQSSIGQTNGFLVVNSNFMMKFLYETSGRCPSVSIKSKDLWLNFKYLRLAALTKQTL